jgi:hypothetical protein
MANTANDRYVEYFIEKTWNLIPAFYRDDDGLADWPNILRSIVEILASPAAVLKRSNDRLWDDAFIDLCDDWVVPYIADLVGTRLVSALNTRGRRVDVAKTIYYRRRKGTLRVLEELISDIAGWEGKAVEEFRRLARHPHLLDPKPQPYLGLFTKTPPGGCADLRRPRGANLVDTAFDEYFHYGDVRRHQGGLDGRYNIHKIGFHLYRIPAHDITGVDPGPSPGAHAFTFDPSGRDIPLFERRSRPENFDWDEWRSAREWELPAPMHCRVLGQAAYLITEAVVLDLVAMFGIIAAVADDLRKLRGIPMETEEDLLVALNSLGSAAVLTGAAVLAEILRQSLVQDSGKSALLPSYVQPGSLLPKSIRVTDAGVEITSDQVVAGNLASWTTKATGKRLVIDPDRGRLLFLGPAPGTVKVEYNYGFPGTIGAGPYSRVKDVVPPTVPVIAGGGAIAAAAMNPAGVAEIGDSFTYGPIADVGGITKMVLEARDGERPYVRLAASWTLTGVATSSLTIDGLWLGASGAFSVILVGAFETVTLRHCTLDLGGTDAFGNPIPAVKLEIDGDVQNLIIDQSITGAIAVGPAGVLEKITVTDSIVTGDVTVPLATIKIRRSTFFGAIVSDRMDASEALILGKADVADTQDGCFRFGTALIGSRIPRPFQSHFIQDVAHFFTSRRFGQPGFAQLSLSAPDFLQTGAEDGSEIGAFSSLNNPIRFAGLKAKVDEYLPFGLIPIYIFET